ncbi:50S ribosomal protein L15e [archaeon]|nr:50S ribosomal protein L15e [archaeon]|tara:strand:+ start:594 stop:1103 length:510 start_codon:yes stop_codon:yes gene_type:complete
MGMYKYIQKIWKKPVENLGETLRNRMIEWRTSETVVRVEKPTRLDRAHALGYKAKKGYIIVRVRVSKGRRMREKPAGGRRSKHSGRRKVVSKSYQWIAEERANRRYVNCEVLNSYPLISDGKFHFFEVILLDRVTAAKYPKASWVINNQGRVYRGKTSAGQKSRGLRKK